MKRIALLSTCLMLLPAPALAVSPLLMARITVNSNQDGPPQADNGLTLREAIELANGTLSVTNLSVAEQAQVVALSGTEVRIEFNLPATQTTIQLRSPLPLLSRSDLVIDGTTQPGYVATATSADLPIPRPVVALTPATGVTIDRGFTIVSDRIVIRGLSLFGFIGEMPYPGDLVVTHAPQPPELDPLRLLSGSSPVNPPVGVQLEANWLGVPPDATLDLKSAQVTAPQSTSPLDLKTPQLASPLNLGSGQVISPLDPKTPQVPFPAQAQTQTRSAFGVAVLDSRDLVIRNNVIANHNGSGIITSIRAENVQITGNVLVGNGMAGMPDAIRLEGIVRRSQVTNNVIVGNAGSAVFLFQPEGAVRIASNQIRSNGQQFRRAAIYLMGEDHQVQDNEIRDQPGPGVTIAAYPASRRNLVQGNRFRALSGLSIDLVGQFNTGIQDYQQGDGPNPPRNSPNRRLDTANEGIDAPRFLSPEFLQVGDRVAIDGVADPGVQIDLYRVEDGLLNYGVLAEPLATTTADDRGRFSFTLTNLKPGDRISAIATDPRYGTSEPAAYSTIQALPSPVPSLSR